MLNLFCIFNKRFRAFLIVAEKVEKNWKEQEERGESKTKR